MTSKDMAFVYTGQKLLVGEHFLYEEIMLSQRNSTAIVPVVNYPQRNSNAWLVALPDFAETLEMSVMQSLEKFLDIVQGGERVFCLYRYAKRRWMEAYLEKIDGNVLFSCDILNIFLQKPQDDQLKRTWMPLWGVDHMIAAYLVGAACAEYDGNVVRLFDRDNQEVILPRIEYGGVA